MKQPFLNPMTPAEHLHNLEQRVRDLEARKGIIRRGDPIITYVKRIPPIKRPKAKKPAMEPFGDG